MGSLNRSLGRALGGRSIYPHPPMLLQKSEVREGEQASYWVGPGTHISQFLARDSVAGCLMSRKPGHPIAPSWSHFVITHPSVSSSASGCLWPRLWATGHVKSKIKSTGQAQPVSRRIVPLAHPNQRLSLDMSGALTTISKSQGTSPAASIWTVPLLAE